jgi:hypothetical protein
VICAASKAGGPARRGCESGSARSPGPRHPRIICGRSRRADEGRLMVQAAFQVVLAYVGHAPNPLGPAPPISRPVGCAPTISNAALATTPPSGRPDLFSARVSNPPTPPENSIGIS